MKRLFISFLSIFAPVVLNAGGPAETVEHLATSDEYWGWDDQALMALDISSIPLIEEKVRSSETGFPTSRSIYLLSQKYSQFQNELSDRRKQDLVDLVVSRVEEMPEYYMDFTSVHESLIRFDHPRVLDLAEKLSLSPHSQVRVGARKIITALRPPEADRSQIQDDPSISIKTDESRGNSARKSGEHSLSDEGQIAEEDSHRRDHDRISVNLWAWTLGVLLLLGGLGVMLRRKKSSS